MTTPRVSQFIARTFQLDQRRMVRRATVVFEEHSIRHLSFVLLLLLLLLFLFFFFTNLVRGTSCMSLVSASIMIEALMAMRVEPDCAAVVPLLNIKVPQLDHMEDY